MAFSNYKSISSVIKKFQINYVQSNFMLEVEFPAKESFKEELDLLLQMELLITPKMLFVKILFIQY